MYDFSRHLSDTEDFPEFDSNEIEGWEEMDSEDQLAIREFYESMKELAELLNELDFEIEEDNEEERRSLYEDTTDDIEYKNRNEKISSSGHQAYLEQKAPQYDYIKGRSQTSYNSQGIKPHGGAVGVYFEPVVERIQPMSYVWETPIFREPEIHVGSHHTTHSPYMRQRGF